MNWLAGLAQAGRRGKLCPVDQKTLEQIKAAYPKIVKNMWENRRCFDSSLGRTALDARVYVSHFLFHSAVPEELEPGYVS